MKKQAISKWNLLVCAGVLMLAVWVSGCKPQAPHGTRTEKGSETPKSRPGHAAPFREETQVPPAARFIRVSGQSFIDPEGRQVLLHGGALINKNRKDNYQPVATAEDFAQMRALGWNCIRLGVLWDGLEPEMNRFDENYLKKLDAWIVLAKAHDLYVFLDMHQDLYSYNYSDGAPEWATLVDDQVHPAQTGAVWSDAYLTSPAVQRAFDNFWANKPCADGVGVQDHFAAAWKVLAERYRDEPAVFGYDLFNEPNIGSGNLPAQEAMAVALAKALASRDGPGKAPGPEEVVARWITTEGRSQLMTRLKDMNIYSLVVDAAGPVYVEFEKTKVMPMFQRVRDAIRTVDTNHIMLLETSMSANMGIPTGVTWVTNAHGQPDTLQAFAPHGYDIVVDTKDLALASNDRLELIFRRHAETGRKLNLPVLIGEWGAFGNAGAEILPAARFHVSLFERFLFSNTYWAYTRELKNAAFLEALQRPIPMRVSGRLLAIRTDFDRGEFTCSWEEVASVTAPTIIYLPKRAFMGRDAVKLSPAGEGFSVEPVAGDGGHIYIVIAPNSGGLKRTLTVNWN
jgi:endoglycosylceramidase